MKAVDEQQRTIGEVYITQNHVEISLGTTRTKLPPRRPSGSRCKRTKGVHSHVDINLGTNRTKLPSKRFCGSPNKRTGKSDISIEKNKHSPSKAQMFSEKLPVIGTCFQESTNPVPTLEKDCRHALQPPARIKLQLFPIDAFTQKVLEKEGYNPHLELTLSKQKKISSVLRHLKSKWGSVYNVGDIMLLPYDIQLENFVGYMRWTLEDNDISAIDVYQAIGSPTIFRLRYGWFPNVHPKTLHTPIFSSQFGIGLQNGNIKQGGTMDAAIAEFKEQPDKIVTKECTSVPTSDSPNTVQDGDELQDNPRITQSFAPPSSIWADGISVGALLLEASMHAAGNQADPVVARNDPCFQQTLFSSDTFDADIAAYRHSQGPQRASSGSYSSILDAEETCHPFPCQKFASLGKDVVTSSESALVSCTQEVNIQAVIKQNQTSNEIRTDLLPHAPETNCVSSSLGMAGVNWNDSLSKFDLSLSSSRLLTSGDNISLGAFLSNSLDATSSRRLISGDNISLSGFLSNSLDASSSRRLIGGDSMILSSFLSNSMDAFQVFARDRSVAPS